MLVPDNGASMMIKTSTRTPIANAVKRIRRGEEKQIKIVAMRRNEISVSAMKATIHQLGLALYGILDRRIGEQAPHNPSDKNNA